MTMPQRTRIKFCGNNRPEDVALAAALGVDFIGFVCVPGSPRAVDAFDDTRLAALKDAMAGSHSQRVALFQNAAAAAVSEAVRRLVPELLQFHGGEGAAFCAAFGLPWIKAVPMADAPDYAAVEREHAAAFALLADSHSAVAGGGSGHGFDWVLLPAPRERRLPLLLAGGLTPETVGEAIRRVRPWGVDVSSGIEAGEKGVKDHRKMRDFVAAVRAADETLAEDDHG
jgi:phosphoribosylanthranilate isomerase